MHSFAIGQSETPVIDLYPGKLVETTIRFDQPGKYTYYCTRWCGADHWRMRGTIEVTGQGVTTASESQQPLYLSLGLDIDAPHEAQHLPLRQPSAVRGAALGLPLPMNYLSMDYYRVHSPEQAWLDLRLEPFAQDLDDQQVWDLVALVWQSNALPGAADRTAQAYAQDCAACHGEGGAGDGVFAHALASHTEEAHALQPPADFTDPASMLGASPAVLHGKIVRGGMGTGMPYWGPIYTDEQIWSLVATLYRYQFEYEEE
jgi:mono/diheme cytochrome c family protein